MDSNDYRISKDAKRAVLMTDEEMNFVNDAIALLNDRVSNMSENYDEWSTIEEYYSVDQDEDEKRANTKVNIINASIEGEVTQIVNPNLDIVATGVSPEDNEFAEWGTIVLDWAFKQNKLPKKLSIHERRRMLFGQAFIKVIWNEEFAGNQGLSEIKLPPLNKVFVDPKVTCELDLQDAEWIAETCNLSKNYAIATYGEAKAEAIDYGQNQYKDNGVFTEGFQDLNERDWTLIEWWSKDEGKLRLREITACGILLYDSFKEGTRETQSHESILSPKSYRKYTDEYPYFFTNKYPKEGQLFGFGDGKLLLSMQKMINELYDKLRIMMRPNLILVDSNTELAIEGFDDNSFDPVYYNGTKLRGQIPVHSIPWGVVNQDFWKLIDNIHVESQRIIRFSDLMTGQQNTTQTATEAAIQQSQGNTHSEHEKTILECTLQDVAKYMLNLMLEKYIGFKAFRIPGEKAQYEWVDFDKMANVPALQPATQSYIERFKTFNPDKPEPQYEHVKDEKGKPMKKSVDLDMSISIGSGLPKNKAFVWQMIEKLGSLVLLDDSQGQPQQKPAINYKEFRKFIKDFLGIPIKEDDETFEKFMQQFNPNTQTAQGGMPPQNTGGMPMPNASPMPGGMENTEGLSAGGGIAQEQIPQEGSINGNIPSA